MRAARLSFFWPEYASDKVIESLANLIRTTLAFGKEVAEKNITDGRVAAVAAPERKPSRSSQPGDQARLEGQRGSANSAAAIEAAAMVIRIAYRYRIVAHARLAGAENALSQEFQQRCIATEREFCACWSRKSKNVIPSAPPKNPQHQRRNRQRLIRN
jgi:hypothetical protein